MNIKSVGSKQIRKVGPLVERFEVISKANRLIKHHKAFTMGLMCVVTLCRIALNFIRVSCLLRKLFMVVVQM